MENKIKSCVKIRDSANETFYKLILANEDQV